MQRQVLSGEYEHSLDEKGRVTLPAAYRDYFSDGAVLVRFIDREPCVMVYHPDEWAEFDKKYLEPLDEFGSEEDNWKLRDVFSNLCQTVPDKQGRVLLMNHLLGDLEPGNKVRILGNRTHLEIWNPNTLTRRRQERSSRSES